MPEPLEDTPCGHFLVHVCVEALREYWSFVAGLCVSGLREVKDEACERVEPLIDPLLAEC